MIYQITVKPNSKKGPLVIKNSDNNLTVYLRAKPHDGEANTELIKILSKHFNIPKTQITIKKGAKSHLKLIEF